MKVRLSFIVPFYGVESFIEDCIRSLYAQDIPWDEYEVICIDDCSPDNSRAIVECLQKEYPTLCLLTTPNNLRQGGARNLAFNVAKGDYVWFVDSDDSIPSNVLNTLLSVVENNALDILQFDYIRDNYKRKEVGHLGEIVNGEQYLFEDLLSDWSYKIAGPWRQIFKYDFLRKNNLNYIEGAMYEDTDYVLHAFLIAERVQHISMIAYKYRINVESVTLSKVSPVKLAWRVNQFARCYNLIEITKSKIARDTIQKMVCDSLSNLRENVKKFSLKEKREYLYFLSNIDVCKTKVSWRTWLAIRYAITWFI